jgi:hypothetical protein
MGPNSIGVRSDDILKRCSSGVSSRVSRSREPQDSRQLFWRSFRTTLTKWGALVAERVRVIGRSHTARDASTTNIILFTAWLCLYEALHGRTVAYLHQGLDASPQPAHHTVPSQLPPVSTMDTTVSHRRRDGALSLLNAAIEAMNLAKEISSATPAKAVFGSVSVILTMIRVCFLLIRLDQPQANVYRILW